MNTAQAIRERIAAQPAEEPFTPALFAGLGSRAAIDQTLNIDKVRTGDLGGTAGTAAFTRALVQRVKTG